jgi:hypothetical protein
MKNTPTRSATPHQRVGDEKTPTRECGDEIIGRCIRYKIWLSNELDRPYGKYWIVVHRCPKHESASGAHQLDKILRFFLHRSLRRGHKASLPNKAHQQSKKASFTSATHFQRREEEEESLGFRVASSKI